MKDTAISPDTSPELWIPHRPDTWPARFGTLRNDTTMARFLGIWENGEPVMKKWIAKAGTMVKIVMVSRFGDVGVTTDLQAGHGYTARVGLDALENLALSP